MSCRQKGYRKITYFDISSYKLMAKWYANGTQNNAYIEWEKPYIQQKRQSFGCLFLFCFAIFIEIPVDYFNR